MLRLPNTQIKYSHPLITTGGTISSGKNRSKALVAGVNGADKFRSLTQADLAAKNIEIAPEVYAPYAILSENINLGYVERLVDQLLEVIKDKDPELIVVSHGTDSMDKVVKLLDYPIYENQKVNLSEILVSKIHKLQELIAQKGIYIVFTGSNTTDDNEIRNNISGAFNSLKRLKSQHPGVYISFHEDLIPGEYAVKDIYDPKLNSMRYADSRDTNYKVKVALQNQQDSKIIQDLKNKIGPQHDIANPTVQDYDVTELDPDHSKFKAKINDQTKAVLLYVYHGGTANTKSKELSVAKFVKDLRRQYPNLVFFAAAENFEPTDLQTYETSRKLFNAGVVPLYDMSKNVALAKLQMLQLKNMKPTEIIDAMLQPQAKEVDVDRISTEGIRRLKKSYAVSAKLH